MYIHRIPFTRDSNKGPQAPAKKGKKASKPEVVVESVIEEPAKIEVIDNITEPVLEEAEPVSEDLDANS